MFRTPFICAAILAATSLSAVETIAVQPLSVFVDSAVLDSGAASGEPTGFANFGYLNRNDFDVFATFTFTSGTPIPAPALPTVALAGRNPLIADAPNLVGYDNSRNLVLRLTFQSPTRSVSKTSTAPNLKDRLTIAVDSVIDEGNGNFLATFGYTGNWTPGITYPVTAVTNTVQRLSGTAHEIVGVQPTVFRSGVHNGEFQVRFTADATISWAADNNVAIVNSGGTVILINN